MNGGIQPRVKDLVHMKVRHHRISHYQIHAQQHVLHIQFVHPDILLLIKQQLHHTQYISIKGSQINIHKQLYLSLNILLCQAQLVLFRLAHLFNRSELHLAKEQQAKWLQLLITLRQI